MRGISEKANHEWIEPGRPVPTSCPELPIEIDGILDKDFLPRVSAYAYTFPGPTLSEIPFDGGSPRASRMGDFFGNETSPFPTSFLHVHYLGFLDAPSTPCESRLGHPAECLDLHFASISDRNLFLELISQLLAEVVS